jgi:hypothetical protein
MLRGPRVSEAVKMTTKCFLKHGIPFQHDPNTGKPERVNLIKVKCVDQRFELRYKLKNEDYS